MEIRTEIMKGKHTQPTKRVPEQGCATSGASG